LDQCGVVLQLSGELDAHILAHFHFNKTPMGMEMQMHVDVGDISGQVLNGLIEKIRHVLDTLAPKFQTLLAMFQRPTCRLWKLLASCGFS
jgi:hypothetical protein